MQTVADYLTRAHEELSGMEAVLRARLPNKNIADVLKSGLARILQASQHADAALPLADLEPHEEVRTGPAVGNEFPGA